VAEPVDSLRSRAAAVVAEAGIGEVVDTEAIPGAGSAPGTTMPSIAVRVPGDHLATLRRARPPVVARSRDGGTLLDLRTVDPLDDHTLAAALRTCVS
jgi:L-seryl-tRNA(Ser) seleniumtransferase